MITASDDSTEHYVVYIIVLSWQFQEGAWLAPFKSIYCGEDGVVYSNEGDVGIPPNFVDYVWFLSDDSRCFEESVQGFEEKVQKR